MKPGSKRLVVVGIVFSAWACVAAAQDFSKAQIRPEKVADGIYLLYGPGGNIGVLTGTDGVLLIDSKYGQLYEKIGAAIAGFGGGPVKFVLNTNGHSDHASGNEAFANAGAVIVAHAQARTRMMTTQLHDVIGQKTMPYPAAALPRVTFPGSLLLHFNGEEIEAIHVAPAHSDSDVLYRFRKSNVIHTGDLFFSDGYPYIDIGNGGTVGGMIAAAGTVLGMCDAQTKLIPGHGRLSDAKRLEAFRTMLTAVRARVAAMVKEGKSLEAVVGARPTAEFDKDWAQAMPADSFVTLVYKDLTR